MILLGDVAFYFSGHRARCRNETRDTRLSEKLFSIAQSLAKTIHIPAFTGCAPQTSRVEHPIGRAQVSTLAQKNGNAAVKVGSSGKESKTNLLMTTSALDFVTATAGVFAPAQLKYGSSICRTENAVNNYPGGKQC